MHTTDLLKPDEAIGQNWLWNWYFAGGGSQAGTGNLPINQGGISSFSTDYKWTRYGGISNTYPKFLDWWDITSRSTSVSLTNSGLLIANNTSATNNVFQISQITKPWLNEWYYGNTMTFSILTNDGLESVSGVMWYDDMEDEGADYHKVIEQYSSSIDSYYIALSSVGYGVYKVLVQFRYTSKTIIAMKLEWGSQQTLCRNIGTQANPIWELNDIPDYDYEFRRCNTAIAHFKPTYGNFICYATGYNSTKAFAFFPFTNCTCTKVQSAVRALNIALQRGDSTYPVTNYSFKGLSTNGIIAELTVSSGLVEGGMYMVVGDYVDWYFGEY